MKNYPAFFGRFVRLSLQVMAVAVLAFHAVPRAAAAPVYIFTTFTGDGTEDMKLRICTSVDAINYSLYSITGYGGPTGSLRALASHFYTYPAWPIALPPAPPSLAGRSARSARSNIPCFGDIG